MPLHSRESTNAAAVVDESRTKDSDKSSSSKSPRGGGRSGKVDGSVTRLREERRDLYDLLYGDDEEDEHGGSDDFVQPSSSSSRSVLFGDENLDDFDPYGLEDH